MTTSHRRGHGPMGLLEAEGLSAGRRVDLSSPISTFHQRVSQNQKLSNGIDDPGYRVTAEISNSMKSDRHPGSAREEDLQPASTFAMRSVWKVAPKRRAGSTHRPPPRHPPSHPIPPHAIVGWGDGMYVHHYAGGVSEAFC